MIKKDDHKLIKELVEKLGVGATRNHARSDRSKSEGFFKNQKINRQYSQLNPKDKKLLFRLVDALHTKRRGVR